MDAQMDTQPINSKRSYGFFTKLDDLNDDNLLGTKKVKIEVLEEANKANLISFSKVATEIPRSFQLMARNAQEFYESCPEIKEWRNKDGIVSIKSYLLSPNPLQKERFPNNKTNDIKFIDILCASTTRRILKCLSEGEFETEGFHLRGPRGIGKSYLLACYALLLRSEENNRVLYINNPLGCEHGFNVYFANEIVYCFWKDKDVLPVPEDIKDVQGESPLEKWYHYMTSTKLDPDRIVRCLDEFSVFHDMKNGNTIKIIFIIDQMNVLYRKGLEAHRDRVNKVLDKSFCHRKIISASDNNEGYDAEKEKPLKYLHEILTLEESIWLFKCFWNLEKLKLEIPLVIDATQKLKIDVNWKEDKKYSDFRKVLRATGNNPHELAIITNMLERDFMNIDDLVQSYLDERTKHYRELHLNYRSKQLTPSELSELYRVVTTLDTGYDTDLMRVYDRGLVYFLENNYGGAHYSVCPAAAQAIKNYYHFLDDEYMKWSMQEGFVHTSNIEILKAMLEQRHKFNGSMRGGAFRKLVMLGLIRKSRSVNKDIKLKYYFTVEKETGTGKSKTIKKELQSNEMVFSVDQAVSFATNTLLTKIEKYVKSIESKEQGILFVPQSSGFALIDCIVIQAGRESETQKCDINLYLFQMTINVNGHEKGDVHMASEHNCKHEICQTIKSIKEKYAKVNSEYKVKVRFIWFTGGSDKDIHEINWKKLDKKSLVVMMDTITNYIL